MLDFRSTMTPPHYDPPLEADFIVGIYIHQAAASPIFGHYEARNDHSGRGAPARMVLWSFIVGIYIYRLAQAETMKSASRGGHSGGGVIVGIYIYHAPRPKL